MYESHWDKEKQPRSKSVMALAMCTSSSLMNHDMSLTTQTCCRKKQRTCRRITEETRPRAFVALWNITWDNFFCIRFRRTQRQGSNKCAFSSTHV